MKVITICDHKGGVAKTTTAAAIAQGIEKLHPKAKVLLIDADPQGTATKSFYGIKKPVPGLFQVLIGKKDINSVIIQTEAGDILPYEAELIRLDSKLKDQNKALKEVLEYLDGYTHVIVDTSPYFNLANVMALTASDIVIIPVGAKPETVESLPESLITILRVREKLNPGMEIGGAVFTNYDGRSNVVKQYAELVEDICRRNGIRILKTRVRACSAINEAHALKENLFKYAPRSNAVKDYTDIIKELKL